MKNSIQQVIRHLNCMSISIFALLLILNTAYAVNTEGFIEFSSEEIGNLIVGNSVQGKYRGNRYVEYYKPGGELMGNYGSGGFTGTWKILPNNVLRLDVDRIFNFSLLQNPETGDYYYGEKKKNGKYAGLQKIKILKGNQI